MDAGWDRCHIATPSIDQGAADPSSLTPPVERDDVNWKQLLMEQLPPLPVGLDRAAAIFGLALASAFIATT
eukprot:7088992-Prymnesium_polylepis.1